MDDLSVEVVSCLGAETHIIRIITCHLEITFFARNTNYIIILDPGLEPHQFVSNTGIKNSSLAMLVVKRSAAVTPEEESVAHK